MRQFNSRLALGLLRQALAVAVAVVPTATLDQTAAAVAPAGTGSIQGTLIDPVKVVISNIDTVATLKNTATGQTYKGDVSKGGFTISGLPAGTYDIDIPIPCCMYRGVQQKAVSLAAGQALKLNVDVGFGMNLGTIGDDPGALGADMRARTKNIDGKPPKLRNGQPDLSGAWYVTLDPTAGFGGRIPMQPWAMEMQMKLMQTGGLAQQNDPGAFCLPSNATPTRTVFPYEFIQGEKKIVQINEFVTPAQRVIYMDGRKHPDLNEWNPAWYGHSIGHWEKDVLVIDTIGFNEITPGYGIHSEKLHVVERIRRPTYGRLEIEITAEDPDAWTAPFKQTIKAGLAEGEDIQEFVCVENNKDPAHLGGLGWRGRP